MRASKGSAQETAHHVIESLFPDCEAAFLAGSVVRGDATATSDLDMVVITTRPEAPYRESLYFEGWPVELFVHSPESVQRYFASDIERRMPSLPMMVTESVILRSRDGLAEALQDEARRLFEAGPEPLGEEAITGLRYFLTDLLDDFEGSTDPAETFFIAAELSNRAIDLLLGFNQQWTGRGKWAMRALQHYDPAQAGRLAEALAALSREGHRQPLVNFVEGVLAPAGGRLFTGFRQAGRS